MTGIEARYMTVVQSSLREIARQLDIANKLSALKLRAESDEELLCEDVLAELTDIMKG